MDARELYTSIGGSYDEALGRLGTDALVARFVVRFLDDESIPQLVAAWQAGNEDAAFKAAHAAKGVTGNLALTRLCNATTQICEALRAGNDELRASTNVDALVSELDATYADAVTNIRTFAAKE